MAASIGAVALITAVYSTAVHVNPTTVALTYLIAILLVATWWGIVEATTASIVAMLCFNFFFLPPVGTLTIADPQNWVALVAFLVTAIVASQLSGRARKREVDAVGRQRDLERLYALSRALLLSEARVPRCRARLPDILPMRSNCKLSVSTITAPTPCRGPARPSCRRSRRRFAMSPGAETCYATRAGWS